MKDNKPTEKKDGQKSKNKLIIIIACCVAAAAVVALVLGLTLGKSKKPSDRPGDTGSAVTTAAPDGASNGPDATADPNDNGGTTAQPDGTTDASPDATAGPAQSNAEPDNTVDPAGDPIEPDDDPIDVVTLPDAEVFVTEGPAADASAWPADKIPSDVPEFKNILKFYNCTYQVDEDIEGWFMSWDAKEADYDKWIEEVSAAGFNPSASVAYYYGNGNIIMDIETEDYGDGTVWVSVDIFRSKTTGLPDALSAIYPAIETTASVWYTLDDDGAFEIHYQCAKDWEGDLNAYFDKLYAAGFELSYGKATKTVDGKTYTITWGTEDRDREIITYSYGE